MTETQALQSMFALLLQLHAAALGVVITLLALVPTMVELVRVQNTGFYKEQSDKRQLRAGLQWLARTIWFFGAGTLLAQAGYTVFANCILLYVCHGLFAIGVTVVIRASLDIARLAQTMV